jgi:hypothetical protein
MVRIVMRVRLVGGDHLDVSYADDAFTDEADLLDHVAVTLAEESGMLRSRHGDRDLVLYGRGVAAFEVSPRGAVL